jgi:hypothetical protein
MTELELLERMRVETPPASALARTQAWRRLLSVMLAPRLALLRQRRRRLLIQHRLAAAAVVAAVIAAAVGVGVLNLPGSSPTSTANAAVRALRQAAANSAAVAQPIAQPGQYVHVHIQARGISFAGAIAYLDPGTTDLWLPADGDGLGYIRSSAGEPVFQHAGDRAKLRASGMWPIDVNTTTIGSFDTSKRLQDNLAVPSYAYLESLPTDPNELYDALAAHVHGCHCGQSFSEEMLTTVTNMLANGTPTAALRAALYRVASQIPGVALTANTTTLDGRTGTAVGVDSDGVRTELIFDPATGACLGQRATWLQPDPEHEIGPKGLTGETTSTVTVTDGVPPQIKSTAVHHPYSRGE